MKMEKTPFNREKLENWKNLVNSSFDNKPESATDELKEAYMGILDGLDKGEVRIAEKVEDNWIVNDWAKKAILLFFSYTPNYPMEAGPMNFWDKVPLKDEIEGIRVVPPAVARYGSYVAKGSIMMPGYVNIGAYVDEGSMVDTWATVGSCAQIGKGVHLSGGVGIGGVLEPPQGRPVIIEDGAFIGSRCIIVEGALIEEKAVLGANVVITGSTKIIDVSGDEPKIYEKFIPKNSVVIPGTIPKKFPAGEYGVPCALIIGKRKESTDLKTSLNDALRTFGVSV
jgi:2,3,4,5-tetrahydropyridine-2-carboxylate N-succinyltransferase